MRPGRCRLWRPSPLTFLCPAAAWGSLRQAVCRPLALQLNSTHARTQRHASETGLSVALRLGARSMEERDCGDANGAHGTGCVAEPVAKEKLNVGTHRARSGTRPLGPGVRAGVGVAGAKTTEMEMMAQRVWEGGLLEGLSGGVSGIGGMAVAAARTRNDVADRSGGARQSPTGVKLRVSPLAISSLLPEYKPAGGSASPLQTYAARPKPAQSATSMLVSPAAR